MLPTRPGVTLSLFIANMGAVQAAGGGAAPHRRGRQHQSAHGGRPGEVRCAEFPAALAARVHRRGRRAGDPRQPERPPVGRRHLGRIPSQRRAHCRPARGDCRGEAALPGAAHIPRRHEPQQYFRRPPGARARQRTRGRGALLVAVLAPQAAGAVHVRFPEREDPAAVRAPPRRRLPERRLTGTRLGSATPMRWSR